MRQYVTEDESHRMWCPMVRTSDENRAMNQKPQDWNSCIGSFCMFWCWKDEYGAGMGVVASDTHGYCGATR